MVFKASASPLLSVLSKIPSPTPAPLEAQAMKSKTQMGPREAISGFKLYIAKVTYRSILVFSALARV